MRWKKILFWFFGVITIIFLLVILVNPLPKYIRYQINKSVADLKIEGLPLDEVEDLKVKDIPIRLFNAGQSIKPIIFYIPGGAFIAGNLDSHDNICRY